ncbi:MAG: Rha family transcriptional regulator [Pseudomonas sp.]|nr:Rha family transcriptional regulator [Pseudomonas sp.]
MNTFLETLHDAVLDAGAKNMARSAGFTSHMTLLQRANPNNDDHQLSLPQFLRIADHLPEQDRRRVLQAMVEVWGYGLVAKTAPPADSPMLALLELVTESADVTRAVHDAMADGRINRQERIAISREISEVRHSLDVLEESVKVA